MTKSISKELEELFEADRYELNHSGWDLPSEGYQPVLPEFDTAEEYYQYYEQCAVEHKEETAKEALKQAVLMEPKNETYLQEYAIYIYHNNSRFCCSDWGCDNWNTRDIIRAFDLLIEINPKNAKYYLYKAKICKKVGLYEKAIINLLSVIELEPDNYSNYELLGDTYFSNNQFHAAVDTFTNAIELNKYETNLYVKRGLSYFNLNNDVEALKDGNKSLSYGPDNEQALHLKYKIYNKYIDNDNFNYELAASTNLYQAINNTHDQYTLTGYLDEKIELDCHNHFYEEALDNVNQLIRLEYDYGYCIPTIKLKIKILFKMRKFLQIIPTFFLLLKKMHEEWKLERTPIY